MEGTIFCKWLALSSADTITWQQKHGGNWGRGARAVDQAREAQRVAEETPGGPKEYVKMDSDAKTEKL